MDFFGKRTHDLIIGFLLLAAHPFDLFKPPCKLLVLFDEILVILCGLDSHRTIMRKRLKERDLLFGETSPVHPPAQHQHPDQRILEIPGHKQLNL